MKRVLSIVSLLGAWTVGCQLISGVNDLEVVDDASGGSAGAGADGGAGGSNGGSGGSNGDGGSGGSAGGGGTSSTSMGGSAGAGGSLATGGTTTSGGTTSTGGTTTTGGSGGCTDQPGWECDVVSLCGCSATENCSYNVDTDLAACNPAGEQEPYHVCDVNADCPRGHGCISGICKRYCTSSNDCGWDDAACLEVYDGDEVIEAFGYCSEECDPVDPTEPLEGGAACDADSTCYAYADDAGNLAHTVCVASDGEGVRGDACDDDGSPDPFACAPGYFCDNLNLTCRRFCEVGDENACEAEGTCLGFSPPAYLEDWELGGCGVCDSGDFDCSVFPECGCGGGDACKITDFDTGATECIAEGTVPAWGACESLAECARGSSCVGGFCDPFCGEAGDNSCVIGDCFQAQSSANEPIPGWFYCNAPCEPVLADRAAADDVKPCPEGYLCQPVANDPVNLDVAAYCAASGGLDEGSLCEVNGDCADGLGCLEGECTPYCRTSADCTELYPTCYNLDPPLYAGPGDVIKQCF